MTFVDEKEKTKILKKKTKKFLFSMDFKVMITRQFVILTPITKPISREFLKFCQLN